MPFGWYNPTVPKPPEDKTKFTESLRERVTLLSEYLDAEEALHNAREQYEVVYVKPWETKFDELYNKLPDSVKGLIDAVSDMAEMGFDRSDIHLVLDKIILLLREDLE